MPNKLEAYLLFLSERVDNEGDEFSIQMNTGLPITVLTDDEYHQKDVEAIDDIVDTCHDEIPRKYQKYFDLVSNNMRTKLMEDTEGSEERVLSFLNYENHSTVEVGRTEFHIFH